MIERFPPTRAAGRGRGWYRGDCHVHSTRSHGADQTPAQLAAAARAVGLDFIAVTEHNTADTHGAWGALAGDDLLVILGQEVTTRTGHWLALGIDPGQVIDWRYGVRDDLVDRHLDQVHRVGGLCVAAHPQAPYPTGAFMYPWNGFDVVEVWNGLWTSDLPWNADNGAALANWGRHLVTDLRRGWFRPAMGNSDAHLEGQIGVPQTVVLADELSTAAILAGLRAGRSWIAGSTDVELGLTALAGSRRAELGERLDTNDQQVEVRVHVRGVPAGTVSVHTEQGAVHYESLPAGGTGSVSWFTSAAESAFVRVEVWRADGIPAALTNPVVLT